MKHYQKDHVTFFILNLIQGGPLFLPPPKKTESQAWGEEKKQSPRTPPMSGTQFFLGVARIAVHPVSWDFKPLLEKAKPTLVDSSSNKPKALIRNVASQPFMLYAKLFFGLSIKKKRN